MTAIARIATALMIIMTVISQTVVGQSIAQKRALRLELGMNLTYLDNFWLGSKDKNFSDFIKASEVEKRKKMVRDIARAGFRTIRIPTTFGAWASLTTPFRWENPQGPESADLFVKWAKENDLNAIIDLHHSEYDGSIKGSATTERLVWLWSEIASRYKNTDSERVFFEIRNEPTRSEREGVERSSRRDHKGDPKDRARSHADRGISRLELPDRDARIETFSRSEYHLHVSLLSPVSLHASGSHVVE